MTLENQILANRSNSQLSTGPTTESGKAVASRNATKWGIFSSQVLLPDEDPDQFGDFTHNIYVALKPVGALETTLADALVATMWRWRRLHGIEAGLLQMYRVYENQDRGLATAFAHDASQMDALGRLSKYETTLERRFQRLLHELQRLQAGRHGQQVPPPAVVDVDVRGDQ